jgi:DNA polymerase-3 subunit delta'
MAWSRIRGHVRQIDSFKRAVRSNRLAHAYLFAGPFGVGKKLFAKELAKALLCEADSDRFEACDQCAGCMLVEAETHPDFVVVGMPADKHEFPIEVMRELCANLALKPARGRRRVAIVDDADDLNDESANCFLKTLEEPPPGSLLILVGTDADRQLPTIRSRCQQVKFDSLPDEALAALLREQGVTDPHMIGRIARLAQGSPGLARDVSDPALWEFRRTFLEELRKAKPDAVTLAKQWKDIVESVGKDGSAQRRRSRIVLQLIVDAFRQMLLQNEAVLDDPVEGPLLTDLCKRYGTDGILDRIDRCLDAEMHTDRRVQLALLYEAVVDALTQTHGMENFRPAWNV